MPSHSVTLNTTKLHNFPSHLLSLMTQVNGSAHIVNVFFLLSVIWLSINKNNLSNIKMMKLLNVCLVKRAKILDKKMLDLDIPEV